MPNSASNGNGVALLRPIRDKYDVAGIDFPRPTFSPAVWLCFGAPGAAAANSLSRWLKHVPPPNRPQPAEHFPESLEPWLKPTLDLLDKITRVVRRDGFPFTGSDDAEPLYAEIKAAFQQIIQVPELRGGERDDVIVPHLWIVADLDRAAGTEFFAWLKRTAQRLRADDIVCRTTLLVRQVRWNVSDEALADVRAAIGWLVHRAAEADSPLAGAFRVLVLTDRDRRGTLFRPGELLDAIAHFAEFVLLSRAPSAMSSSVTPLFKPHNLLPTGADPWERLPIFGSLWITRLQIEGSDTRTRIDPVLRDRVADALLARLPESWVPPAPAFHGAELARATRWASLDLPEWRTLQWEGPREETQRFAVELDRWLDLAAAWRRGTLATYIGRSGQVDRQAEHARQRFLRDLDQLGALALDDRDLPGAIELLQRLVARAKIEIEFELRDFPPTDPALDELPSIKHDDVERLIPHQETPLRGALKEMSERIACRVNMLQMVVLTIVATLIIWRWTVFSIRHWDDSGFGWLGRQNLPFKIRDPILLGFVRIAHWIRDRADTTPLASISMLQWVLIGFILGAIAFDVLVALIDRVGTMRAFRNIQARTKEWRSNANRDLPILLAHRELLANHAAARNVRNDLFQVGVDLEKLGGIVRSQAIAAPPPPSVFSAFVRLASPPFAAVTDEDVHQAAFGVRHAIANRWRTIRPEELAQVILDQEEPITARGGRIVHDPRAELEPLMAMIRSQMPIPANILVPPMATAPVDTPRTTFGRIVAVPAHSSGIVRDMLRAHELEDVAMISHEPERVGFVVAIEVDVAAHAIFGEAPPVIASEDLTRKIPRPYPPPTTEAGPAPDSNATPPAAEPQPAPPPAGPAADATGPEPEPASEPEPREARPLFMPIDAEADWPVVTPEIEPTKDATGPGRDTESAP